MQRKQQYAAGCNRMLQDAEDAEKAKSNSMQRKQQAVTLIQQDASGYSRVQQYAKPTTL
jgi:hypothetical protein